MSNSYRRIKGPAPKRRNPVQRAITEELVQRNAGAHHTRDQDVEDGRSRKPKHKGKQQEEWYDDYYFDEGDDST